MVPHVAARLVGIRPVIAEVFFVYQVTGVDACIRDFGKARPIGVLPRDGACVQLMCVRAGSFGAPEWVRERACAVLCGGIIGRVNLWASSEKVRFVGYSSRLSARTLLSANHRITAPVWVRVRLGGSKKHGTLCNIMVVLLGLGERDLMLHVPQLHRTCLGCAPLLALALLKARKTNRGYQRSRPFRRVS